MDKYQRITELEDERLEVETQITDLEIDYENNRRSLQTKINEIDIELTLLQAEG